MSYQNLNRLTTEGAMPIRKAQLAVNWPGIWSSGPKFCWLAGALISGRSTDSGQSPDCRSAIWGLVTETVGCPENGESLGEKFGVGDRFGQNASSNCAMKESLRIVASVEPIKIFCQV